MACHEDLAFLAPGFIILLIPVSWQKNRWNAGLFLKQALIFSGAFFVPFLLHVIIWGPSRILSTFYYLQTFAPSPIFDPEKKFPRTAFELLTHGLAHLTGWPWMLLLYSQLALALTGLLKDRSYLNGATMLIPVFCYCLLFDLLVGRNNTGRVIRLLIPLLPFLGVYFAAQLQRWCDLTPPRAGTWAALAFAIYATAFNFENLKSIPSLSLYNRAWPEPFYRYQSVFRRLHDKLKNELLPDQKILIAPSAFKDPYDTLNLPFYFNGQALLINPCTGESSYFQTFLRQNNIRYVFISKVYVFNDSPQPEMEVSCLLPEKKHNKAREIENLMAEIALWQPQKVEFDEHYGTLYRLRVPGDEKPS